MRILIPFFLLVSTGFGQNGKYPPSFEKIIFPDSTSNVLYGIHGSDNGAELPYKSPARSDDGGRTWTPLFLTTAGMEQLVTDLAVHPTNPQIVLVSTSPEKGGVYRSTDGGRTWKQSSAGLPTTGKDEMFPLRFSASDPQTVYVATRTGVYKSIDGGLTWALRGALPQGSPPTSISPRYTRVGFKHTAPVRMYVMAVGGAMYSSKDEGATWDGVARAYSDSRAFGVEIQVDPVDPALVHLQTQSDGNQGRCNSPGGSVWQSKNGGGEWILLRDADYCNFSPDTFLDTKRPYIHLRTHLFGQQYCRSEDRGAKFTCSDVTSPVGILFGRGELLQTADSGKSWHQNGSTLIPTLRLPIAPIAYQLEQGSVQTQKIKVETVESTFHKVPLTATTPGASWLRVTQTNPQTNTDITIEISAGTMAVGEYNGVIHMDGPDANNKSVDIPVKLVVRAPTPSGLVFQPSTALGGLANFSKPYADDVLAADASAQGCSSVFAETNGSLLVFCNDRVRRIDATTKRVHTVEGNGKRGDNAEGAHAADAQFNFGTGVVSTSDGAVWVADEFNNKFKVIRNGVVTTAVDKRYQVDPNDQFGLLTFSTPRGAFLDTDGRPVALTGLGAVKVSASGIPQTLFLAPSENSTVKPVPSLSGVCVDRQGGYYNADAFNHILWHYTKGGEWIRFAGTGTAGFNGDGLDGPDAQCSSPTACATDTEGNVYVADRGNDRIRVMRADGKLYTAAGGSGSAISDPEDVATDALGNLYVAQFTSIVKVERQRAPKPTITQGSFVSAASGKAPLAQGSLFSLYGGQVATETLVAKFTPWPARLGGAQVKINGVVAPLYFSSTGQINGQVPFETAAGNATIQLEVNGTLSDTIHAQIVPAAPSIFVYNGARAVAVNPDGRINADNAGAAPDSVIVVYFTGQGPVDTPVATGAAAPGDKLVRPTATSRATIGGQEAKLKFIGLAPGFVGLGQANVQIPSGLKPGNYPLTLVVGGVESPAATITVAAKH